MQVWNVLHAARFLFLVLFDYFLFWFHELSWLASAFQQMVNMYYRIVLCWYYLKFIADWSSGLAYTTSHVCVCEWHWTIVAKQLFDLVFCVRAITDGKEDLPSRSGELNFKNFWLATYYSSKFRSVSLQWSAVLGVCNSWKSWKYWKSPGI